MLYAQVLGKRFSIMKRKINNNNQQATKKENFGIRNKVVIVVFKTRRMLIFGFHCY